MSSDSIGLPERTLPRTIHQNVPALELSGLLSSAPREEIISFESNEIHEEEKVDLESDPISGSMSLSNTLKKSSVNPKLAKYNDKIAQIQKNVFENKEVEMAPIMEAPETYRSSDFNTNRGLLEQSNN